MKDFQKELQFASRWPLIWSGIGAAVLAIVALFVIHLSIVGKANAAEKPSGSCMPSIVAERHIRVQNKGGEIVRVPNAKEFMLKYNALPPVSSVVADDVIVVFMINTAATFFFKDGCLLGRDRRTLPKTLRMLLRATGQNV